MNKSTFFTGQPVFTQLLSLIPKSLISELARKHQANRYYKSFMVYDHLVTMLYAGYFQCASIREVVTGLKANALRLGHLGLKSSPGRSTLSDANAKRPLEFFAELYSSLYKLHFCPDSRSRSREDNLLIIDSTTISVFSSTMKGAGSPGKDGKKKGGAKAHMMVDSKHDIPAFVVISEAREADVTFLSKVQVPHGATVVMDKAYVNYRIFNQWASQNIRWVTRLRETSYVQEESRLEISEEDKALGITSDILVTLGRPSNIRQNPQVKARIVEYHDKEKDRDFTFVTNDLTSHPYEIANLYKRRWQIELLFKRIKQRYPLRYFLGDNANAIQIQIWSALICDLLVRIVQRGVNNKIKRPWAYASISSMIKHHLMSYLNLYAFLQNPDNLSSPTVREWPPTQLRIFRGGLPN